MGIYLSNMEMPTSCEKCPFLDYEEGFCFASGAKGKSGWYEFTLCPGEIKGRRHDDCPLVPVLPHGRLIDADAAVVNRNAEMNWVYDLSDLPDYLADCPTIIPAEEVYCQYTDTAGNFHWCGTHSGEHTIKAEEGE